MREEFEFRIPEVYAGQLFAPNEGESIGYGVRKVVLSGADSRLSQIGELDATISMEAQDPPRYFFSSWEIRRHYTPDELSLAEALHITRLPTFEPCGEQCDTAFDESAACPHCGAGAKQESDLRLDLRKAPKTKEIARTIAGEVIVSQRLADLMLQAGLTGFEFGRVRHKARYEDDPIELSETPSGREILLRAEEAGAAHPSGTFWVWLNRPENAELNERVRSEYASFRRRGAKDSGKPAPVWHQLLPTSFVDVAPPTQCGVNPFDLDEKGEYRCPRGDTLGLNLLSELSVSDCSRESWDVTTTRQYFGARQGVLRPERRLLISPRFLRLLEDNGIKGYRLEVAHIQ